VKDVVILIVEAFEKQLKQCTIHKEVFLKFTDLRD